MTRLPWRRVLSLSGLRWLALVVVAGGLVYIPLANPRSYLVFLGMTTFAYVAMSYAWDILGGLTGQVSFGYGVYFGLGAYATGIAMLQGVSPYVGMVVGAIIALVASVIIGVPTFRLRGPYFAIATIGVNEAVRVIMLNWRSVTGGASGLPLPSTYFSGPVLYRDALILMLAAMLVYAWLVRSPIGLALNAIREDEDAASALGVDPLRYKLLAHGLGAVIVALAGGIIARWDVYIEPISTFGFGRSIEILMMPVIGGSGTFWGPLLGGFVFTVAKDQIVSAYPNLHLLLYGLLLALIILFEPKGAVGLMRRMQRWYRAWRGIPTGSSPSSDLPQERAKMAGG